MTSKVSFSAVKTPTANVADGREARPKCWYAAYTRSNAERTSATMLESAGFDTYLASRIEVRQWSDRKKRMETLLIPRVIFIHAEPSRLPELVKMSCLTSILKSAGNRNAAVIPDEEMNRFMFLIGNAPTAVEITPIKVVKGEKVEISRGPLRGLEGIATHDSDGTARLTITIDNLCCASISVPITDLTQT